MNISKGKMCFGSCYHAIDRNRINTLHALGISSSVNKNVLLSYKSGRKLL